MYFSHSVSLRLIKVANALPARVGRQGIETIENLVTKKATLFG
jgi:hypothetical protein